MKDIQLTSNGDLFVNPQTGDIEITDSVAQAIRIRLLWFWQEWRLGTQYGVPYYEDVLVKNPSIIRIKQVIREAIMSVKEVSALKELEVEMKDDRTCHISYVAAIPGAEDVSEEVSLYG